MRVQNSQTSGLRAKLADRGPEMLFNSPLYGVFLLATFAVFWLLYRHRLPRALFLVLASYGFYFYGTWDAAATEDVPLGPWGWAVLCLGIIFVGSTIDYWVGRALGKTRHPHARKALLLISIVYYLGVLSVFKYWNFAADSFTALLELAGVKVSPTHLRLILPFGISFFTFETMSYTIDVYREELPPADKYLDYLLFVCFFPHLVAGPIVRPRQMLPQLAATPVADPDQQSRGLWLITTGLAKKIVIGDYLAQNLVARAFGNPERYSSVELVVAVYAYAVQIYCDFSGYTDVAVGSARLFGYELPQNFDSPYIADSLQDFWRRWHISLSTWLRDYLYVPLGGSRKGPWKTYRNLMITMVLGGLWHGASFNFVIWGALHGGGLAVTRMWQRARGTSPGNAITKAFSVLLTFHIVCLAWIFFRAPTLGHAWLFVTRIARGTSGIANVSGHVAWLVGGGLLLHALPWRWVDAARERFVRTPPLVQGAVLAAAAYGLHLAAAAKAEPFVYGQF
jgi:alginate O-acetyltransferase complex protein AlgI